MLLMSRLKADTDHFEMLKTKVDADRLVLHKLQLSPAFFFCSTEKHYTKKHYTKKYYTKKYYTKSALDR